jgi:hypothetical protein
MPNWHDVFIEIQTVQAQAQGQALNAQNAVRHKYLKALSEHTGRNTIAYYSGWLSKGGIALSEINDEDKNGFMTTIHKLERKLGLVGILGQGGRDSEIDPVSIPKLIRSRFRDEAGHGFRF